MSTPLDRLKEAFPESKGWVVVLCPPDVETGSGGCGPNGTAQNGWWYCEAEHSMCVAVSVQGPDAETVVSTCIAKAREVGINSDAEAHADGLAEALKEAASDLYRHGDLVAWANASRAVEAHALRGKA